MLALEVRAANPGLALRPGQVVSVEEGLGPERAGASVPLAAVLRGDDGVPFCFVVDEADGGPRAAARRVALGPMHDARVEIASGLAQGERVVVRGQHYLADGDPLAVVEARAP